MVWNLTKKLLFLSKRKAKKEILSLVLQTSFKYFRKKYIYTHNKPPPQTPSHWLLILFEWAMHGVPSSQYIIVLLYLQGHSERARMTAGQNTASILHSLLDSFPPNAYVEALGRRIALQEPRNANINELLGTNYLALQIGTISKPL